MPTRTLLKVPAKLMPTRIRDLRPEHMPRLPSWYPLDRKPIRDDRTGEIVRVPPPYTDAERRRLREERAINEAATGPYDGQAVVVTFEPDDGPPKTYQPVNAPGVLYRLDELKSTRNSLVYRYDPGSPIHRRAMLAVESAFEQAGRDYAIASREEETHDRTQPKL